MKRKKLRKHQLIEKQNQENRTFNRTLLISFTISIVLVFFILTFYMFRCETRFLYHQWVWYGKKVPVEWTCLNGSQLLIHESSSVKINEKTLYFCSQQCLNHYVNNTISSLKIVDAYSGDSIFKADALIGIKEKGKPDLLYFKNAETLNQYYASENK